MKKLLLLSLFFPLWLQAATQQSAELSDGLNQPIEHWQFSSAANRTGATGFFNQDVGKIAYQTDDQSFWRLIGITPSWIGFPSTASSPTWTGTHTFTSAATFKITDSGTTNVTNNIVIDHETSGTPGVGFGANLQFNLQDATTASINAAGIKVIWADPTHNGQNAYMDFGMFAQGGFNTAMRLFRGGSGSGGLSVGSTTDPGGSGTINANGGYMVGNVNPSTGLIMQSSAGAPMTYSTATWPTGAAAAGTRPIGNGTNWIATTPTSSQSSPTNPTGTTSTTGVMMGLAGTITTSASTSGKILIVISGTIFNSTAIADGGKVQIRHGTGSAPANAAALTGTADGGLVQYIAATTAQKTPFSCNAIVSSLTASTTYWLDVGLAAITAGTATITDVSISAHEL